MWREAYEVASSSVDLHVYIGCLSAKPHLKSVLDMFLARKRQTPTSSGMSGIVQCTCLVNSIFAGLIREEHPNLPRFKLLQIVNRVTIGK